MDEPGLGCDFVELNACVDVFEDDRGVSSEGAEEPIGFGDVEITIVVEVGKECAPSPVPGVGAVVSCGVVVGVVLILDEQDIAWSLGGWVGDGGDVHIEEAVVVDIADINAHAVGGLHSSCDDGLIGEGAVLVVDVVFGSSRVTDEDQFGVPIAIHVDKLGEESSDAEDFKPGLFGDIGEGVLSLLVWSIVSVDAVADLRFDVSGDEEIEIAVEVIIAPCGAQPVSGVSDEPVDARFDSDIGEGVLPGFVWAVVSIESVFACDRLVGRVSEGGDEEVEVSVVVVVGSRCAEGVLECIEPPIGRTIGEGAVLVVDEEVVGCAAA